MQSRAHVGVLVNSGHPLDPEDPLRCSGEVVFGFTSQPQVAAMVLPIII